MKNNKGITLVALVVTIIVLLILAAVSMNLVLGDNGIVTRAKQASKATKEAAAKEQIAMAVAGSIDETGEINYNKLKENLSGISDISDIPDVIDSSSFPFSAKVGNHTYIIQSNGKIIDSTLPSDYVRVDYIESTGSTYIDTNVMNKSTINIEAEVYGPNTQTLYAFLGGRAWADGSVVSSFSLWGSVGTTSRFDRGGQICPVNAAILRNERCKVKTENLKLFLNDICVTTSSGSLDYEPTNNIYIFGQNTGDVSANNLAGIRFYYLKMYDGDELIRDMIPCYRKNDNKTGMYDTVNKVFYTNAASDENFIIEETH